MYVRFVMNIIVRNAPQHTTNSTKLTIIVVSIVKRQQKINTDIEMKNKERIYHEFLLRLYENTMYGDGKLYDNLKSYYYSATNSNPGEEQKDLTEILK